MHRTSIATAVLAAAVLTVTGCSSSGGSKTSSPAPGGSSGGGSSSSSGGAKTNSASTLVVWADNSANTAKAITPLCQAWAAQNGVTCQVKLFNGGGDLQDALIKGNATGDVPDIFEGPHDPIGTLANDGILAPVDLSSHKSDFLPAAVAAVTYNGNTYGVPWAIENVALMTNKSMVGGCPSTLDDAVSKAKGLISSGKATKGLGIAMQIGTTGDAYHWYSLFTADGGYAFGRNSDGSYNSKDLGVGKPGSIAAAKRLQTLVKEGILSPSVTYDIARQAFSAGKAPYFITGPWQLPDQKKALGANLEICPVPAWKGSSDKPQAFLGVRTFFQTAKAKHPALASTFLNDTVMTTAFQTGMYKVDPRSPAWKAAQTEIANDPLQKGFADYGANSAPIPNIPQMAAVFSDLGLAEYKIASGTDPTAAINQAKTAIVKTNAALK